MRLNGAGVAARLVAVGLPESERAAKAQLFDRAFHLLGGPASAAWWVPGRLEVFGKHTDYAGGRSLVCALPRGVAFAARTTRHRDVRIAAEDTAVAFEPGSRMRVDGWAHYAQTVVRRLERNFPRRAGGVDIAFAADLPPAAGLSSSSALVVGFAEALVRLREIDRTDGWRAGVADPLAASAYYASIENGSAYGSLDGDAGVGTHGGSEDHAAIVRAEPAHVSAFAFVPLRTIGLAAVPREWTFVIAPSGVRAEKTGLARDPYNRLAHAAGALLALWNTHRGPADSLGVALSDGGDDPVRDFHRLIDEYPVQGWTAADLHDRLDHFVREDARVPYALAAFASADAERLAALSAASQHDADTLLRNQVEGTRTLAASARAHGAFAASAFGAGFGGSVWALVRSEDAARFAGVWHPDAFLASPGPPLTAIAVRRG
jgi:galactokinase